MKKIISAAALIFVIINSALSQKKLTIYLAGNFGLANAKLKSSTNTQAQNSFSSGIGAHVKLKLSKNFDFVLQPIIQGRGYVSTNASNKYDIKVTYIDIPVDIEYDFGLPKSLFGKVDGNNFFVGAGAYGGMAIAGKFTDNYTNDPSVKMKFGDASTDNRSVMDYGLNFVAGMSINDWGFGKHKTSLRCGFQKQVGSKNVIPSARQTSTDEIKLRNFSLFVAIKI